MSEEAIVAVFDTAAHADAAIRDLEAASVPSSAISRHAESGTAGTTTSATAASGSDQPKGFWTSLFGGETEDSTVYERSVAGGSTVVTVKVPEQHIARVSEILERHNPIDLNERAASYGATQTTTTTTTAAPATTAASRAAAATDGSTIQLAEEQLAVGKRVVNRGTTRVRRYVVETPVEEQVSLHSEKVVVDRRPVTGEHAVTEADFTDKVIEMTETSEEAVVGKTARVVEEISLRKEGVDRTETVRDTVRKEEVEIEETPAVETTATTTTNVADTTPNPRVPKV